tara:strand:- start:120 stop:476 length:357 start_codon:yes stop_codon:yes gene_type:complete
MTWMEVLKGIQTEWISDCCNTVSRSIINDFSGTGTNEWDKWIKFVKESTLNGNCEELLEELRKIEGYDGGIDYFINEYMDGITIAGNQQADLYLRLRDYIRDYEECKDDLTGLDHRFR